MKPPNPTALLQGGLRLLALIWLLPVQADVATSDVSSNAVTVAASSAQDAQLAAITLALDNSFVDHAEDLYMALPQTRRDSLPGQIIAARLLAASDIKAGFKQLQQLATAYPEHPEVQDQLGRISVMRAQEASMFSALGYAKDAVKYWQRALQLDPQYQRTLQSLATFYLAAPGIAGGDDAKAAELTGQLLQLDRVAGLSLQALMLRADDKNEQAMTAVTTAIAEFPDAAELHFLRAGWLIEAEQWQAAWEDLLAACRHAQDEYMRSNTYYQMGRLAVKSERFVAAGLTGLLKVQALKDPRYSGWTQLRLAQLYQLNGELQQAQHYLQLVDEKSADKDLRKQRREFSRSLQASLAQPGLSQTSAVQNSLELQATTQHDAGYTNSHHSNNKIKP